MPVIFCGDTAVPFSAEPHFDAVRPLFDGCSAIVNLEGAILPDCKATEDYRYFDKFSVYSAPIVIEMLKALNVKAVSLCNNHILDFSHPISYTVNLLKANDIASFGLNNHEVLPMEMDGRRMFVVTFATFACEHSLPLFVPSKVVGEVASLRRRNPDALIAVYPHWGREKFYLPDPADRELAHRLVDAGANLIVGHHPHIVQPIEHYKGVPIIYSLGNFFMAQADYAGKTLRFALSEMRNEAVLKWDGENIELIPLLFDPDVNTLMPGEPSALDRHFDAIAPDTTPGAYRSMVRKASSITDNAFRTRLFDSDFGERLCYAQRTLFRAVRRAAIRFGAHRPK